MRDNQTGKEHRITCPFFPVQTECMNLLQEKSVQMNFL